MNIQEYIEINQEFFLNKLFQLLRIDSVSSDPARKHKMQEAAQYWAELIRELHPDKVEIHQTSGNPIVYAEKIINTSYPTVIVYGHYDVMPEDPIDLWVSPPFEPEIRDGKIYARGADDDKGQSFIHWIALRYLLEENKLNCNVKFILEGEEEVGSTSLSTWLDEHKENIKGDVVLVSDTGMIAPDVPTITMGLRGLTYLQVEVTGPNRDLHSGLFGGAVANPIVILSHILSRMIDLNGTITIPGFYDKVMKVSEEDRKKLNKVAFSEDNYKQALGVRELFGEKEYTVLERTGIRPSFDVCGIWGGYTGEGAKTIIPSKAYAKISARLVPYQDNKEIAQLIKEYIEKLAPSSVTVKVDILHGGQPYVMPSDHPAYLAAELALKDVFGKDPVHLRSGGSIPIIATIEQKLGIKSLLMGFGLESDAVHSPNENFPLNNLWNGVKSIVAFYLHFPRIMHEK
ncbi:MAG: dipeptidase [Bacteroidales bacterium]|nr:dipeptidase [Bacteroidales bacterium]